MPSFLTRDFGNIEFEQESVIVFPAGLPGFDHHRRFLALHFEESAPLVLLQSLEQAELCFVTLPVRAVDPEYRLHICDEDLEAIGMQSGDRPSIGTDLLCLAVVSIRPDGTTANLLAPVVVNLENHHAVQAIAQDTTYSHRHTLVSQEVAACS